MADNINEKMSSLADAIRRKSGNTEKLSIDSMTAAVSSINVEPAVKLDNVTVSTGDILSGKIAVDASGAEITGTIPTVAAVSDGKNITVPVGYIAIEQNFELGSLSGDLSDATLSPGTMLAGVVGYGASGKVVGMIETVFPVLEGNVFSVPSGFVPVPQTLTVPVAGEAVIAANTVVIPAGYVAETRTVTLPEMGEIVFNGNQVTIPAGFAAVPLTVSLPEAEIIRHGNEMIISTGFVTQKINISLGSDISDGDVTPQTMLAGVVGYGASGRVVGTIETVTPVMEGNTVFIPAGYLPQEQIISTGSDTATDTPPEPADIREGKTAFANGVMISGTMPDITVVLEGNRVSVPAGYHPEDEILTVGTAMEETVIIPGTENRIIPGGTFLSGELLVAGDSALSPLNIREGVTIFNVRGSLPVGEREIRFGYLNDDLLFQELDLSGSVPEKYGSPEQTLFYIFKTGLYEPDAGGGNVGVVDPDSGGLFEAVKVTEYSPGAASVEIVTQVEVSGFGEFSYPEDDWSEDYSYLNGSYEVTPETADKTGRDRIYIHESGEFYLIPVPDDGEGEGWGFADSPDTDIYLFVLYNSDLTGGVASWYNSDWGEEMEAELALSTTVTEAQPMVLKGVMVSGYKDGKWEFETEEITLAGFQRVPLPGGIYCLCEGITIGNYIAVESSYGTDDHTLLMLSFDSPDDFAKDTSAYNHPVIISGGSACDGRSGNGWNFNGGYLQVEPVMAENEFNFGTSDFTLEAWIYPTAADRQCLWARESGTNFAICFSYNGDCRIGVFGTANSDWNNFVMSDALTLNDWHHIAIVRKGNLLSCFINFKKTAYSADMTGKQVDMGNTKFGIGRWDNDPYDFRAHWKGMMDDIRISNIARY